jgi:hypothetical protein
LTELRKNSIVRFVSNPGEEALVMSQSGTDHLEEALAMSQTAIESGLVEARAELAELREREAKLEELIARAELALGGRSGDESDDAEGHGESRMTLHVALQQVLRENDNRWMSVRELSDEINRRALYRRKDGAEVEPNQVHARTKNYTKVFEKDGSQVRLLLAPKTWDVVIFQDDDAGFFGWLDGHPNGFFINAERNPGKNYLVLHNASCSHFDRDSSVRWTSYTKICSDDSDQLEGWARQIVGGEVTLCKSCFG